MKEWINVPVPMTLQIAGDVSPSPAFPPAERLFLVKSHTMSAPMRSGPAEQTPACSGWLNWGRSSVPFNISFICLSMFIINPFYDHTTLSRCKVNHYFPHHQTFPHFFHQQTIIIHQQPVITPLPFAPPRPRRTNTRTSCVKYSHIVRQTIATLLLR